MDSTHKSPSSMKSMLLVAIIALVGAGIISLSYIINRISLDERSKAAEPTIITYYVDCQAGNDSNNGTSEASAWRTFSRPNSVTLSPGDRLLLKKDCTWLETLNVRWTGTAAANVVVGAYGTGTNDPIVEAIHPARSSSFNITGDYITIQNVYAKVTPTNFQSCGSGTNPVGYAVGFELHESSSYITVQYSKATGGYAGVAIKRSSSTGTFSHHNRILNNVIENNLMMNPLTVGGDDDAGGFGVLIRGDDNEIAYNTISGHDACSHDYTRDGGAVEIFGGLRNNTHHNRSIDNDAFTELGDSRGADNTFAYNLITSSLNQSIGILTRGVGNFGPVLRTKAYNNTIYLTGAASQGLVCANNCGNTTGDILTAKNNIFWADWKAAYAASQFNEGNNIYWRTGGSPVVQGISVPAERKVNPQFVSAGSNFHILFDSYARNNGSIESVNAGYTTDYESSCVPEGTSVDIGAYEYYAMTPTPCGPTTTPSPPTNTPTLTPTPTPTTVPLPTATPTPEPLDERRSDVNRNGVVNGADFGYLNSQFGGSCSSSVNCADINCDRVINATDFNLLRRNFGLPFPTPAPACGYWVTPTNTPVPTPTSGPLQAIADTYANSSAPDTPHGSSVVLVADAFGPRAITYLKFDLSSFAGSTIASARLRITTTSETNAGSTQTQFIYPVTDSSWSESTLTYNLRPAVSTTAIGSLPGTTIPSTTYEIILSPSAIQQYAGGMLSLAIDQTVDDGFRINSREVTTTSVRPHLIITTGTNPLKLQR